MPKRKAAAAADDAPTNLRAAYEGRLWESSALTSVFSSDPPDNGGQATTPNGGAAASGSADTPDGEVNAAADGGFFARFGAPAQQRREEHAGAQLGTRRVAGGNS